MCRVLIDLLFFIVTDGYTCFGCVTLEAGAYVASVTQ